MTTLTVVHHGDRIVRVATTDARMFAPECHGECRIEGGRPDGVGRFLTRASTDALDASLRAEAEKLGAEVLDAPRATRPVTPAQLNAIHRAHYARSNS